MMAACAREDKSENADANDRADPTERALPMLSVEPTDPAEPIDPIEPTDATERIDPRLPIERIESSDHSDHRERADITGDPFPRPSTWLRPLVLEFRSAPLLASRGASTRA
jgi:hypothetical protein